MSELRYERDQLLTDHDYAAPHLVDGRRMHGGFLADGSYVPPRTLVRGPAIDQWADALRRRGGDLLDADASLLTGIRLPSTAQSEVLLRNGLGQTFWNTLTITGKIEARGRLLAEWDFPDLQPFVVDDISDMAIGHLGAGLLYAHGLDEGGQPDQGIGGHDEMWFVARDLAFGPVDHPDVDPMDDIGRPEAGTRYVPEIDEQIETIISFLANLLIIEFRAELGFAEAQHLLRHPELFPDRRAQADEAAEIIERIRIDEEIHVRSLRVYLGEIQQVTLRTLDGGTIAGREVIDRFWAGLVEWATVGQPSAMADQQRAIIGQRIAAHAEAERVQAEFDAAA